MNGKCQSYVMAAAKSSEVCMNLLFKRKTTHVCRIQALPSLVRKMPLVQIRLLIWRNPTRKFPNSPCLFPHCLPAFQNHVEAGTVRSQVEGRIGQSCLCQLVPSLELTIWGTNNKLDCFKVGERMFSINPLLLWLVGSWMHNAKRRNYNVLQ